MIKFTRIGDDFPGEPNIEMSFSEHFNEHISDVMSIFERFLLAIGFQQDNINAYLSLYDDLKTDSSKPDYDVFNVLKILNIIDAAVNDKKDQTTLTLTNALLEIKDLIQEK